MRASEIYGFSFHKSDISIVCGDDLAQKRLANGIDRASELKALGAGASSFFSSFLLCSK